jgi:hypothetical protein
VTTCRACGARLADGAAWCSLCFAAVSADGPPAATSGGPDAPTDADTTGVGEVSPPPTERTVTTMTPDAAHDVSPNWTESGRRIGDHQLLVDGDARGWRCALCATAHPIDELSCGVCGTSLFSAAQRDDERRDVPVGTAALWSVVPGGGQWVVGQHLQAPARFATIVLAFAAAFTFPASGPFLAARLLFLVVGAGLWVVSGSDACAVAAGRRPLLTDRRLLWTSAGLLGLLVVATVVGVLIGVTSRG